MDYIRMFFALKPSTYSRLVRISRRLDGTTLEEVIDQASKLLVEKYKIDNKTTDADLAKKQARDWNIANKIGASVILTTWSGTKIRTKTQSEAYVSDHGNVIIRLKNVKSVCYLARVQVAKDGISSVEQTETLKT